jgi:hypothetical protein
VQQVQQMQQRGGIGRNKLSGADHLPGIQSQERHGANDANWQTRYNDT